MHAWSEPWEVGMVDGGGYLECPEGVPQRGFNVP